MLPLYQISQRSPIFVEQLFVVDWSWLQYSNVSVGAHTSSSGSLRPLVVDEHLPVLQPLSVDEVPAIALLLTLV